MRAVESSSLTSSAARSSTVDWTLVFFHCYVGFISSISSIEVTLATRGMLKLTSTSGKNCADQMYRVLNAETGDDLLSQTGMTSDGYAITVTLFSVAYAVFEVPSNWIMKHYVRPSVWLVSVCSCVIIDSLFCYISDNFRLFSWGPGELSPLGPLACRTMPRSLPCASSLE